MKRMSLEGTERGRDESREREEGGSERRRDGARKGGSNWAREMSNGGSKGGARKGGKFQGRYLEEDSGQYAVYSAQNNPQRGPCA